MCADRAEGCASNNDNWLESQEYPNSVHIPAIQKIEQGTLSLVGALAPTSSKVLKSHLNSLTPEWGGPKAYFVFFHWKPELESQMFPCSAWAATSTRREATEPKDRQRGR